MTPIFLAIALQAATPYSLIGDPAVFTPPGAQDARPAGALPSQPAAAGRRISPRAQDSISGTYSLDPRSAIEATQNALDKR